MAVLKKDELLKMLKERIGEDTSDEAIKLIEDFSDTIEDYETKTKDSTDWEKKYKDNDESWRKKYKERFFNSPVEPEKTESAEEADDDESKSKNLTYENLFKEETK